MDHPILVKVVLIVRAIIRSRVWPCLLLAMMAASIQLQGQNPSRKHLGDKHQWYYDSLMKMKYDRVFPILGDKVYKKGFDIPWPIGIMINSFYGNQGINISDINVGIKGPDSTFGPVDLSQVIVFDDVSAKAWNLNARVDMYVLPFLNVYGLLAWLPTANTKVQISKPVNITSNPSQSGWAYGFGVMAAGGIGPLWIQGDYNATWADMQLLENKVFTQVSGIRLGHVFPSRKSPEKNFSLWIGMMGIFINNNTVGEIKLADVFPDIPQSKIDEIKNSYSQWYDRLGPAQQKVADKIVSKLQDQVNGLPVDDTYITYQMNKSVKSKWAGLMGVQFQFSKRWQFRTESNFISSDRFSILTSINYRFLGFKKKTGKN